MPKQPAKKKAVEQAFKIIRTEKCQTISKKSTLTYSISKDAQDHTLIKISSNSGGGFFSNEWISLDKITDIISTATIENPITSIALSGLFVGRSVNNQSFMLAVLIKEGLLKQIEGKNQHYLYSGTEQLLKSIGG